MTNDNLQALSDAGVSIWLDDLSRDRLDSGNLAELVKVRNVVGVTTNPSIFQAAMSQGDRLRRPAREAGRGRQERRGGRLRDDHRRRPQRLRRHEAGLRRHRRRGRPGVDRGRPAARPRHRRRPSRRPSSCAPRVDREQRAHQDPGAPSKAYRRSPRRSPTGISVNVTLIFSLERYRAVMNAYLSGLEQAHASRHDLSKIESVASFFVSRVDTEIDKRLDAIGTDEAKALKGKAGVANARLAYQAYEEVFSTPRWKSLEAEGARPQRPLWASTGVKDPAYKDTMYVVDLVAPGIVNTMPEKTLDAVADHGEVVGDTITPQLRGRPEGPRRPRGARRLLQRRRAGPRERGRRQVREVVGRAARRGHRGPGEGGPEGSPAVTALSVSASGPAADAIATAVPQLVDGPVRLEALRQGPHAVGRGGRVRVVQAALVGRPGPDLAAARRRDRRAARRPRRQGARPRRALRHGRLVAGAGGHLRDRGQGARRARLVRPRLRARAPCRTSSTAPSSSSRASPAPRSRPTRQRRVYEGAFTDAGIDPTDAHRHRHRPGQPARQERP